MPVIYAPADRRAIRAMQAQTVRAALYVYSRNNADFMKVRRLTHVWLHHGDSDKEACFRRKSAAYDVLAVAGQAAIDRYAAHGVHIPSEKFKILVVPRSRTSKQRRPQSPPSTGQSCSTHQPGTPPITRTTTPPSYWRSYRLRLTCAQCNSDLQAAPGQPQTAGGRRCRRNSRAPPSRRRGDGTAASVGRGGRLDVC